MVGSKFTISPIRVSQGEEARNSDRVEQDLYNLYHIMFISDHLCLSAYVCINIYIIYIYTTTVLSGVVSTVRVQIWDMLPEF